MTSSIHRIPLRYDLVRDEDRRMEAPRRFERERPDQLWQMLYLLGTAKSSHQKNARSYVRAGDSGQQ